jgi:hypothetical protein
MAAAGKWKVYEDAKKYLADGTFDLDDTTNWKMALFLSTSNANTLGGTNDIYGDLTNEHANANGYTTGGVAITGVTWVEASGTVTFDCDNAVWTAAGGSIVARFAVIYKNATVNTIVKPLLCVCLLDTAPADVTATDTNTLTVSINAGGVFQLSGAAVD